MLIHVSLIKGKQHLFNYELTSKDKVAPFLDVVLNTFFETQPQLRNPSLWSLSIKLNMNGECVCFPLQDFHPDVIDAATRKEVFNGKEFSCLFLTLTSNPIISASPTIPPIPPPSSFVAHRTCAVPYYAPSLPHPPRLEPTTAVDSSSLSNTHELRCDLSQKKRNAGSTWQLLGPGDAVRVDQRHGKLVRICISHEELSIADIEDAHFHFLLINMVNPTSHKKQIPTEKLSRVDTSADKKAVTFQLHLPTGWLCRTTVLQVKTNFQDRTLIGESCSFHTVDCGVHTKRDNSKRTSPPVIDAPALLQL